MEKIKLHLNIRPNKNIVLTILLCLGIAWSMFNIWSAAPDPGHVWADIGNNANDALVIARGGTGATTLTADNVILGNAVSPVKFVAPGTTGNVLASNGITWASSNLTGLVTLLYSDETSTAETNTSTTETDMKSWLINITPSTYASYLLEAEVEANKGNNNTQSANWTWNFNNGTGVEKTIIMRPAGSNSTGLLNGGAIVTTLSAHLANNMAVNANLKITGKMSASNANLKMKVHSFRVYGVK